MRIAVPSLNGEIFAYFGNAPEFTIFEIVDGRINGMFTESMPCGGNAQPAVFLSARRINVVICGNIGEGSIQALNRAGIECVRGKSGEIIRNVGDYLMSLV